MGCGEKYSCRVFDGVRSTTGDGLAYLAADVNGTAHCGDNKEVVTDSVCK